MHTIRRRNLKSSTGGVNAPEIEIPAANAASTGGNLAEKREQAKQDALANFKFTQSPLPKWNGGETACYNASTKVFTVDTSEKFAYALHYAGSNAGATINITKDIDMGGRVFSNQSVWSNITFNGNNHKIYNFKATGTTSVGICKGMNGGTAKNATFISPYCTGTSGVGIFVSFSGTPINNIMCDNIHVEDGLFYAENPGGNASYVGSIVGSINGTNNYYYVAPESNLHIIKNSGSSRCTTYGSNHIGGSFGIHTSMAFIDCYSENGTIISTSGHSGCVASCSDSFSTFTRCWSNSTIYGAQDVGGIAGIAPTCGSIFRDCFTACIVEGNNRVGGIVGYGGNMIENTSVSWMNKFNAVKDRRHTFTNCYSASMVGMNYQGTNLGGFAGTFGFGTFTNCYVSGEVGSIDTNTTSATGSCGGFFGLDESNRSKNSTISITNCYYDMQTTAMKNKAVGNVVPLAMVRDATGVSTVAWNGIKGLTTKKMTGASNIFSSGYTYVSGLYPQITSLTLHGNIKFRAQSSASAATVFCDDWSDIQQTGFDTVRDTMRNYSFSSSESFGSNTHFSPAQITSSSISDVKWTKDGNISPIDRTSPVIELASKPYYTTSLSPGIEWVEVSLKYTNGSSVSTGNRRLRLIPTSRIETGGDKRVDVFYDGDSNETSPYDHKEGFATTYLDASTLLSYLESSTAHPESLLTFEQVVSQQYADGVITGTANLSFNSQTTNLAITATMQHVDGTPAHIDNLYEKLNGTQKFESADCGIYKIIYKAALKDDRYLSIGKKLVVVGPWSVVYNYNYTGLLNGERIFGDSIFEVQSNLVDFDGFTFAPFEIPPVRDGWKFSYWSLDKEGKSPVAQKWFDDYEKNFGTLNRNIDVYAQYNRLSHGTEVVLTIKPGIGTYGDKGVGEDTMASGNPGDRIVVESAGAPDRFVFEGWDANPLGGGVLEKAENDNSWVFTFGDEDAVLEAQYKQVRFNCDIRWIDKQTDEDIVEPVRYELSEGDAFSLDTAAVDSTLYAVGGAAVTVTDAVTGEELSAEDIGLVLGDDGKYSGTCPARDIRIDVSYDRLIQMLSTGETGALVLAVLGSALIAVTAVLTARQLAKKGEQRVGISEDVKDLRHVGGTLLGSDELHRAGRWY